MWIALNDAFLSIVAHRDRSDVLLVRALLSVYAMAIARPCGESRVRVRRSPLP
jgi:hypothetical protein